MIHKTIGKNRIGINERTGKVGAFIVMDADKSNAADLLKASANALDSYQGIHHSVGSYDTFKDFRTNVSVRNEFRRSDYDYFRPGESIPRISKEIIGSCMDAYRRVGIVRNVIDLMADFAVQGVNLVHPNPQIQKFYRGWFKWVNGHDRSERFLNLLYRCGNVVVKRTVSKVPQKAERELRSIGADGIVPPTKYREIPSRYDLLSPLSVEILGGELAQFTGKSVYAFKITSSLRMKVVNPRTEQERQLVASLPAEIVSAIKSGKQFIPLDADKVLLFHYKKDDWQEWADPLIYAILSDIQLMEKMKLADLAALDGAISQIRIWKLGSLETQPPIFPTDEAIDKLIDILLSNPGGGAFDLVWGPELSIDEFSTDVSKFLGNEKYIPVLNNIYAGLGVPPTLTGSASASGFTNNYISLKTLVQRLEYGRRVLLSMWEREIVMVQRAMGFAQPAKVRFDRMVLTDEAAEKALLLQLIDRNKLSDDTILERFGEDPELETLRMRRENRQRKAGLSPPQAGPWFVAEKEHDLMKIALTKLLITPKEAGLDINENFKEPSLLTSIKNPKGGNQTGITNKSSKGIGGRPKNVPDGPGGRKTKTPSITTAEQIDNLSEFFTKVAWAKAAQSKVLDIITPIILKHYNKKNVRSLSSNEYRQMDIVVGGVLSFLLPFSDVTDEIVYNTLGIDKKSENFWNIRDKLLSAVSQRKQGDPTVDEVRMINAYAYSIDRSE